MIKLIKSQWLIGIFINNCPKITTSLRSFILPHYMIYDQSLT